ncbi:MAG: hypothetical protein ACRELF_26475, partial [Gemmataceae bacterium]
LGVLNIPVNVGVPVNVGFVDFNGNSASQDGGAIDSDSGGVGNVNIVSASFENNTAASNGGAIETTDPLYVNNSSFTGNKALGSDTGGYGGAIDSYMNNDSGQQQQILGSIFTSNSAAINGGAIDTSDDAAITDDTFLNNSAGEDGGAIANEQTEATLDVTDSGFFKNNATQNGGAIENFGSLYVSSVNVFPFTYPGGAMFFGNTAQGNGGAIDSVSNSAGTALNISGTNGRLQIQATFTGNEAVTGSGGAVNTADNTTLNIDSFSGNKAGIAGGAVNAIGNNGFTTLTVTASIFDSNQVTGAAGTGNAISTSANTDVETSSFTNNSAANPAATDDGGAIAYIVRNVNDPPTPFNSSLTVNQDYFGSNDATVD